MTTSTVNDPTTTLPYPPIHKDAKFVVLSDWDGTSVVCANENNAKPNDRYVWTDSRTRDDNPIRLERLVLSASAHHTASLTLHIFSRQSHVQPHAGLPAIQFVRTVQNSDSPTNANGSPDLVDNYGFGRDVRRAYTVKTRSGEMNSRDSFYKQLKSVIETSKLTFDQCVEIMTKESKLDPGFANFFHWCKDNDVPVVIVSSGMEPLIRAVLSKLIGEEDAAQIDIISNGVTVESDGAWEIQFRHPESGFGHDKSRAILPYRELPDPPVLFFFGDGVSDLSAAAHADILFAKTKPNGENDLVEYCDEKGIKYVPFKDFDEALPVVRAVVQGDLSVEKALSGESMRL